ADGPGGAAGRACLGGEPGGVQQAVRLVVVVLPAQEVQVLDLGGAALARGAAQALLDVVALGGPGGGARASGDGALPVAEPEVLEHRGGGGDAVGREREEGAAARAGEDAVPDGAAAGEGTRHRGRQRGDAV